LANIIGVAGYPGSGKTSFLRQLSLEGKIDWFMADIFWPSYAHSIREIQDKLNRGLRVGVDDQHFIRRIYRHRFEECFPGRQVRWIFFEANVRQCLINIMQDTVGYGCIHGRQRLRTLKNAIDNGWYEIPVGTPMKKVLGISAYSYLMQEFMRVTELSKVEIAFIKDCIRENVPSNFF